MAGADSAVLESALALHQAGELDAALAQYRAVLAADPAQAGAWHLAGLVHYARDEHDAALAHLRQAVALRPKEAVYRLNLGHACRAAGAWQAAVTAYQDALLLSPGDAALHVHLAEVLEQLQRPLEALAQYFLAADKAGDAATLVDVGAGLHQHGQRDAAETCWRRALALDAHCAAAHNNLGGMHEAAGELDAAAACYRAALAANPALAAAHRNLAGVLAEQGARAAALRHYAQALQLQPDDATAAFRQAALLGDAAPQAAPEGYVARLFDQYAEDFDEHLTGVLHYRTPATLRALFDRMVPAATGLRVFDVGCGTGLAGAAFVDRAAWLAGVDLSARMLEKARSRGLYQQLEQGEAVAALSAAVAHWDLLLAADVFVYLGDLRPVLLAAAGALRPGGWLLFSVEQTAAEDAPLGYRLAAAGRYQHTADGLRALAAATGWQVRAQEAAVLRHNAGTAVPGLLCAWQRDGGVSG
jgi:predicted TPR repeat methyltransferase